MYRTSFLSDNPQAKYRGMSVVARLLQEPYSSPEKKIFLRKLKVQFVINKPCDLGIYTRCETNIFLRNESDKSDEYGLRSPVYPFSAPKSLPVLTSSKFVPK